MVDQVAFAVFAHELELNFVGCRSPLKIVQGASRNLQPLLPTAHHSFHRPVVVAWVQNVSELVVS